MTVTLSSFSELPEGGLDLVTNRKGAILSAFAESPGPDWKPGSGFHHARTEPDAKCIVTGRSPRNGISMITAALAHLMGIGLGDTSGALN